MHGSNHRERERLARDSWCPRARSHGLPSPKSRFTWGQSVQFEPLRAWKLGRRPVYNTVEKCTGRWRALAQDMVIWGKGCCAGEDERTIKYFIQVGGLRRSSLLSKALRLSKKLDLRRTPLLGSVRHVGIHVIFFIHVQCSPPPDSWP